MLRVLFFIKTFCNNTVHDSDALKKEIEKQALLAYLTEEYELGKRDGYGQRINTVIHLKRKDTGADVSFVTGWMSYPNGELVLTTTIWRMK